MWKKLLIISCFIGIKSIVFAQNVAQKKDFDFFCRVKITESNEHFEVFLEFGGKPLISTNDLKSMFLIYQIVPSFEGGTVKVMDTVALNESNVREVKNNFYTQIAIKNKSEFRNNVLIIRILDSKTSAHTVQSLRLTPTYDLGFHLEKKDVPFGASTAIVGDSLIFRAENMPKLLVYRFKNNFEPATTPMQTQSSKKAAILQIDSTFTVQTNAYFQLPSEGLYFAQIDTTTRKGWGFLVTNQGFPKYKYVGDLLKAVVYISTPEEAYQTTKAAQKKPALDRFWFQIGEKEEIAKRLIRRYYDRIEYANRSFTSFKEGWKTDRGMIYVVFGKPDFINKGEAWEEWVYDSYSKNFQTRFMFQKQQTIFSNNAFELVRDQKYRSIWYEAVEKWRRGKID